MKRLGHAPSAFALVEILVAVSVALVVFGALPATHQIIARLLDRARDDTAAVALAQAKLEEIIADPAAAAPGGGDAPAVGRARFERRWTVLSEEPTLATWTVTVTVGSSGNRPVTLESVAWVP
jgi:hypothetical protein